MKILKNILILAVMAMGLSLAASAQTQAGNNGCQYPIAEARGLKVKT
jgi:hypothetical protein